MSKQRPTANPKSLGQELVQINEIFGLVKQYTLKWGAISFQNSDERH